MTGRAARPLDPPLFITIPTAETGASCIMSMVRREATTVTLTGMQESALDPGSRSQVNPTLVVGIMCITQMPNPDE